MWKCANIRSGILGHLELWEEKHIKTSVRQCGQKERTKWDSKGITERHGMRCRSHWEIGIKSSCHSYLSFSKSLITSLTEGPHCAKSVAETHCNFYRHALPCTISNLSWWARAQRHRERKQLAQSRLVAEIKIGSRSPAANWMHPVEKSVICLPSPQGRFQAEKSVQIKKQGKGESEGLRILIGILRNMLTICDFLPVESSKEINKYRWFKQKPRLSSYCTQSLC